MSVTPIAEIQRRINCLALRHQADHWHKLILIQQCGNLHKTSRYIEQLRAALANVQLRRLKRERVA